MSALLLRDTQQVTAAAAFVDAKGNPASPDTAPVWASSDETVATVVASVDGLTATVTAVGKLGTAQISVKDDDVIITGDVEVVAGLAVSGSVTFGAPTEQ